MADSKLSQLTALAATPASGDQFLINDVSDTTYAASGTNKKLTAAYVAVTDGNFTKINGGGTVTLPATSGTVAMANFANTFSATQTFSSPIIWGRNDMTIAAGVLAAPTASYVRVEPESGTTDDLDTISNGTLGQLLILHRGIGGTIVVKHGTGNIRMDGGADFTMNGSRDKIFFIWVPNEWQEISRSDNS